MSVSRQIPTTKEVTYLSGNNNPLIGITDSRHILHKICILAGKSIGIFNGITVEGTGALKPQAVVWSDSSNKYLLDWSFGFRIRSGNVVRADEDIDLMYDCKTKADIVTIYEHLCNLLVDVPVDLESEDNDDVMNICRGDVIENLIKCVDNITKRIFSKIVRCDDIIISNKMKNATYYKCTNSSDVLAIHVNVPYIYVSTYTIGEDVSYINNTESFLANNSSDIETLIAFFIDKASTTDSKVVTPTRNFAVISVLDKLLLKSTIDNSKLKNIIVRNDNVDFTGNSQVFKDHSTGTVYKLSLSENNILTITSASIDNTLNTSLMYRGDFACVSDANDCCRYLTSLLTRLPLEYRHIDSVLDNLSNFTNDVEVLQHKVISTESNVNSSRIEDTTIVESTNTGNKILLRCVDGVVTIHKVFDGDEYEIILVATYKLVTVADASDIINEVNNLLTSDTFSNNKILTPHKLFYSVRNAGNDITEGVFNKVVSYVHNHELEGTAHSLYKYNDTLVLVTSNLKDASLTVALLDNCGTHTVDSLFNNAARGECMLKYTTSGKERVFQRPDSHSAWDAISCIRYTFELLTGKIRNDYVLKLPIIDDITDDFLEEVKVIAHGGNTVFLGMEVTDSLLVLTWDKKMKDSDILTSKIVALM